MAAGSQQTLTDRGGALADRRPRQAPRAQAAWRVELRDGVAERSERELAPAAGDLWELPFSGGDLSELRGLVANWAAREAMPFEHAEDLVLAVHEIAANSIRHGGGSGTLRLWREGESLTCEIRDAGYIADRSVGQVKPTGGPDCGRGVWIAQQLCDLVQIGSGPEGTVIRLHMRLGGG